jgi:hypothetical protein
MKNFTTIVGLVGLITLVGMVNADNYVNTTGIDNGAFFTGFDEHVAHLNQYNAALEKYNGLNQVTATIGGITYKFGVIDGVYHFDAFNEQIP